ncbi:MAG: hypothetical protein EXR95_09710 [Gemmatimonadetes bacterium]|nr:hypothetical protein [Gemmatimonadota bacterium]
MFPGVPRRCARGPRSIVRRLIPPQRYVVDMPALPGRFGPFAMAALALLLLPAGADAQDTAQPVARATYVTNHADLPTARAVRTDQRIAIDAQLDEPVWMTAPPVTDFWQYDPDTGLRVSEPIEVRILYDDEALYVGARLSDKDIVTRLVRRDGFANDTDIFIIYLDSYHDHRTAYRFAVNAAGWRRDLILSGGGVQGAAGLGGGDASWDPVWAVKTRIGDGEWFVEERIPFSQLRFSPADEQVWGLQLERKIRPLTEENVWSWTPSNEAGGVARFGHLVGITGIKPGRKLEMLPYVGGRAEYIGIARNPDVSFTNPFRSGSDYFGTAGVDLKYRVTSNLTLDGTINPDFGQVELDPAVINLTAFETRYAERRPFFVEGAEIFDFGEGGPSLVYSRRVGRAPQGDAPDAAAYSVAPGTTTILGAAKLTGKTPSGWSMGFLNAVTARERASWLGADRVAGRFEVEPATNYFAGRVRRELRAGQTVLGVLATGVARSLEGSPLQLHARAFSGGVDFSHQWGNRVWEVQGLFSPSLVQGSEQALIATQRTSSRYFQRPDADGLGVDSSATSLAGYSARVAVAKQAGLWRLGGDGAVISPGYEVNDLGFQSEAGRFKTNLSGGMEHTRPGRHLRSWSLTSSAGLVWNYGGDRVGTDIAFNGSAQLPDLSRLGGRLSIRPETLTDRLTRGGPLAMAPAGYSASVNYSTDGRTALSGRGSVTYGTDRSGAWNSELDMSMMWRISTLVDVSLGPNFSRGFGTAQYVSTVTDKTATSTYGRRYVFADLRQTTTSLTTRLNATLTPLVSFEVYAQPFISSARYERLKELAAGRTFDFSEYGTGVGTLSQTSTGSYTIDPDGVGPAKAFGLSNRDFNFRSLRGNAVFRWEWRAGSTLFLVWQQNRSGRLVPEEPGADVGAFDFGRDARALFDIRADNIFLIKLSYWLNP